MIADGEDFELDLYIECSVTSEGRELRVKDGKSSLLVTRIELDHETFSRLIAGQGVWSVGHVYKNESVGKTLVTERRLELVPSYVYEGGDDAFQSWQDGMEKTFAVSGWLLKRERTWNSNSVRNRDGKGYYEFVIRKWVDDEEGS